MIEDFGGARDFGSQIAEWYASTHDGDPLDCDHRYMAIDAVELYLDNMRDAYDPNEDGQVWTDPTEDWRDEIIEACAQSFEMMAD